MHSGDVHFGTRRTPVARLRIPHSGRGPVAAILWLVMNTTSKHPALAFAAGLTLVAASFGMLGAGAYATVAGAGGSFVELGAHGGYQTDRYALATDTTNWRSTVPRVGRRGAAEGRVAEPQADLRRRCPA